MKPYPRAPGRHRARGAPDAAALVELVADEIGVAKSTIEVTAGHIARLKSLGIKGGAAAVEARVTVWLKRFA